MAFHLVRSWGVISLTFISVWVCAVSSTNGHNGNSGTVHVQSGQSIQAAIDTAPAGQRIVVEAGTYAEQLTIGTDGLSLIGVGAVLIPPAAFTENTCSGLAGPETEAGICITGHDVELAPFVAEHRKVLSVGRPVKDVLVTGFEVRGFSGLDIAVVGAQDSRVIGNQLWDGGQYGCLTVGSTNTQVDGNNVVSTQLNFIGICMDDTPGVQVSNNHISGNIIGLCVQTSGAAVRHNDVVNSCIGAFVDPGITGAELLGNHISNANPICATLEGVGISGIIIDGAVGTIVKHNLIEGLTAGGLANQTAVAVVIVDDATTNPVAVASGNIVKENIFRNNDLDVYIETEGSGNIVEDNQCSTSTGLCVSA